MTNQELIFITPYIEYQLKVRHTPMYLLDAIDIEVCKLADMNFDISDIVAIENLKNDISKLTDMQKFGLLVQMLVVNYRASHFNIIKDFIFLDNNMCRIYSLFVETFEKNHIKYKLIQHDFLEKLHILKSKKRKKVKKANGYIIRK